MSEEQMYRTYQVDVATGQMVEVMITRHQFLCQRYGLSEALTPEEVEAYHAQKQAEHEEAETVSATVQSAKDLAWARIRSAEDIIGMADADVKQLVADIVEVLK